MSNRSAAALPSLSAPGSFFIFVKLRAPGFFLGAVHFVHQRHHFIFGELFEALRNHRVLVRLELLGVGHVLGAHLFDKEEDDEEDDDEEEDDEEEDGYGSSSAPHVSTTN